MSGAEPQPQVDPETNRKGLELDRKQTSTWRIGAILLGLQLILAAATLVIRVFSVINQVPGPLVSGHGYDGFSLGFAVALSVIDLAWLAFYWRRSFKLQSQTPLSSTVSQQDSLTSRQDNFPARRTFDFRDTLPKTLARMHAIIAWLICHTALIPFILLADRAEKTGVKSYPLILTALLIMGLIPVISMAWLDLYLTRKFSS